MTRARDVADTQDNVGGAVAPFVAGKNAVINGGFDIWQRGTSFAASASGAIYTADRWMLNRGTLATGATVSRQNSGLTGFQYSFRVQRDSGNTGTTNIVVWQNLETINSIPFAGKTITFSYYVRVGANFSASSIISEVYSGTGTDQNVNVAGFTGSTNFISNAITGLSTSYMRVTQTATVPTNSTQLAVLLYYTPTGTAGANDYFEITGLQLEIGSIATPFSRAGGSIGGELALCQRYYYRQTFSAIGERFGSGYAGLSTLGRVEITFPMTMRVQPTALEQTGTASDYSVAGASVNAVCTSVPTWFNSCTRSGIVDLTVASVLTPGVGVSFRAASAAAYFGWSAEL